MYFNNSLGVEGPVEGFDGGGHLGAHGAEGVVRGVVNVDPPVLGGHGEDTPRRRELDVGDGLLRFAILVPDLKWR